MKRIEMWRRIGAQDLAYLYEGWPCTGELAKFIAQGVHDAEDEDDICSLLYGYNEVRVNTDARYIIRIEWHWHDHNVLYLDRIGRLV